MLLRREAKYIEKVLSDMDEKKLDANISPQTLDGSSLIESTEWLSSVLIHHNVNAQHRTNWNTLIKNLNILNKRWMRK